jgi:hypothetical protein
MKLAEELRGLRDRKKARDIASRILTDIDHQRDEVLRTYREKLTAAADRGLSEACIFEFSGYREDLMDFSGCYADRLEDPSQEVQQAQYNLVNRSAAHFRGWLADVRDLLEKQDGLRVVLKSTVAGQGCRAFNVWQVFVEW